MKDASFNQNVALPNANAHNSTALFAIGTDGNFDNKWRIGFFQIDVPAMVDNTNTSVTTTLTMQHGSNANGSDQANTNPLIQVQVPGIANGSAATSFFVPMPPRVLPYVSFLQTVPTNGTSGNGGVNYDLVT